MYWFFKNFSLALGQKVTSISRLYIHNKHQTAIEVQSLRPETFYFPIFLAFTVPSIELCSVRAHRSQSTHHAFTLRSLFIQRWLIVQSDNIIFKQIIIDKCSSYVIFFWLLTKHNIRITPEALRKNRSSCVHRLLCAQVCALCSLTVYRS